jgi:hypothetical protein
MQRKRMKSMMAMMLGMNVQQKRSITTPVPVFPR